MRALVIIWAVVIIAGLTTGVYVINTLNSIRFGSDVGLALTGTPAVDYSSLQADISSGALTVDTPIPASNGAGMFPTYQLQTAADPQQQNVVLEATPSVILQP